MATGERLILLQYTLELIFGRKILDILYNFDISICPCQGGCFYVITDIFYQINFLLNKIK